MLYATPQSEPLRTTSSCERRMGLNSHGLSKIGLTPSSSRPSRRCRGIMVTISISQRNAISGGVTPRGRGNAM